MVFGSGFGDTADRKSPGPGSRSVSRAASMVFGRGDTSVKSRPASPAPALPLALPLPLPLPFAEPLDVSDATKQAPGTPGVLPGLSDRRREAWEDDDAEVGQAVWRHEDGRLGVLPSPSVQESVGAGRKGSWIGEPVVTPLEELRGEEDAAAAEQSAARDGADWKLPSAADTAKKDVPVQEATQLEQPAQAVPTTTEPPTTDTALPATLDPAARRSSLEPVKNRDLSSRNDERGSTSYTLPSPPMARPPPERKFSALDELPSQQRRRQYTPSATPRKMSLAGGETADPLPSLGATPAYSSQVGADQTGNESAIIASPTRQPKTSRPATPANWEKLSFISPSKKAGDASSRRSSVSSLGNPESHDTIIKSGAASKRHSVIGMLDSSAGEVGAPLDQRRSVSPLPLEPTVTESRGQTFVPYAMPPNGSPQTADFMNRNYQPSQSRPVSYMAHSRKSSAVSHQDVVNMQQANKRYSMGGGGVSADYPIPGAAVYQQQTRSRAPSLAPSRAPSLGHPPSEYDRLRSPQPGDGEIMVGDPSSRRSSGYFHGPDMSTGALGAIPSPSKIDDNYNALVHPQGSAEVVTPLEQPEQQQQPQKKRKSGIMDSFRRASSFHSNANNSSRPSSHGSLPLAVVAANISNEFSLAKTKTLKKPQRAPSSAVEPPKNKRFSTLGSIFRRSSSQASPRVSGPVERQTPSSSQQTVAAATPPRESKKLRKSQPMSSQPLQPQQQQYPQRPPSHYAGPPPGNYAAYEAMMRQQAPPGTSPGQSVPSQYWQQQQQQQPTYSEPEMMSSPYQQRPAGYYQQGPPQGQYQQHQSSQPNSRTHSLVGSPVAEHSPPSEYYGAASPSAVYGQPTSPSPGQPRPQVRRLHSEGYRRRDTVPGIPEANSPVNSSEPDGQSEIGVAQVSPQRVVASPARPTVTTRQSSNYSQASVMVSPVASQTPDNFPQAPGRQDYQTQYWQHQHQQQNQPTRSSQALPPLQTQPQPVRQQSGGVGSIDHEVARSPALDYQHHQQAPWSISLPQQSAETSSIPNRNSFAQQQQAPLARSPPPPQEQQYRMGPPAAARGAVRSPPPPPAPRYQDQYSAMTPYHFVPPQQIQNTPPRNEQRSSHYGEQVSSPVEHSAPPPQEQAFTPAQHYQNAYGAPRPQQPQQQQRSQTAQARYYNQQQQQQQGGGGGPRPQQQQQQYQQQEALPLSYQRSPSGYSGRRDDAAVSEAELMSMNNPRAHMRGASYPGQEWVPGR
jgi:hypothetical protein